MKYDFSADNIGSNGGSDLLDYSSIIDRTDKMKRRWLRVIDNKEKLIMDTQRQLKAKLDKMAKSEKAKKKKREDNLDDDKMMIEKRKEKMFIIQKRREHIH